MAYVTPTQLRLTLAGSENAPGTAAALSDADLQDAIDEAQSEVDGRLEGSHSTPYTGTPPTLVVNVTRDIAAYLATLTARKGDPIQQGDPVMLRYTRAQKVLADIASGTITLPSAAQPGTVDPAPSQVAVANPIDGDLWSLADFDLSSQPAAAWPNVWP